MRWPTASAAGNAIRTREGEGTRKFMPLPWIQTSVFVSATKWFVGLATGQLAVIVATIAVAIIGLMMLDGRLDWRRGARVLLGCFLIFGAGTLASAFMAFGSDESAIEVAVQREPQSNMQLTDPNE